MGIAPAGVEKPNTGQHHLIIDAGLASDEMKAPLPADDYHKHFGGGQTEGMVTLPKGKHTLQLVLGDWSHMPFAPPVMPRPITVTVREAGHTPGAQRLHAVRGQARDRCAGINRDRRAIASAALPDGSSARCQWSSPAASSAQLRCR